MDAATQDKLEYGKSFFSKFEHHSFRENQAEAIDFILSSDKPVVVLESPTGSGKSLIAAVAGAVNGDCIYLCHSKALQDQLIDDFPEFELLKGRANYLCGAGHKGELADACVAKKCVPQCPYNVAKKKTIESPYRALNYSYFMTEANHVGAFSNITDLIICDEADILESVLSNFITLNFSEQRLLKLKISIPKYKTTSSEHAIPEWREWAKNAKSRVGGLLDELEEDIKQFEYIEHDWQRQLIKDKKTYSTFHYKLGLFLEFVDETWLSEQKTESYGTVWSFKPVWLTQEMTQQFFLRHAGVKVVLMSATFPKDTVLSKMLGIPLDMIAYKKVPNTFPSENRPIYLEAAGNLSFKTFEQDIQKVVDRIDDIIEHYPNEKGVIHCVSYKLRKRIQEYSRNTHRFITHDAANRIEKLEEFKDSPDPLVLLSPSMERGVSLNDELARFAILAKCPYESLADKRTKQRLYGSGSIGQAWYTSMAIQATIQAVGRGVRSKTDHCDVYIMDEAHKNMLQKNARQLPEQFRDSIMGRSDVVVTELDSINADDIF